MLNQVINRLNADREVMRKQNEALTKEIQRLKRQLEQQQQFHALLLDEKERELRWQMMSLRASRAIPIATPAAVTWNKKKAVTWKDNFINGPSCMTPIRLKRQVTRLSQGFQDQDFHFST